jgi:recombination protein RecA
VAEFDILYGTGINRMGDLVDMAVAAGLIAKNGAWYSMGDERLGQGRDKACETLKERAELAADLRRRLLDGAGLGAVSVDAESAAA